MITVKELPYRWSLGLLLKQIRVNNSALAATLRPNARPETPATQLESE